MAGLTSTIIVVGSLNIDYIAAVQCLPRAGQTVSACGLVKRFGGKGANQAVAAARQGADVNMIGCVGADDDGRSYSKRLRSEGIRIQGLSVKRKALTGTALIAVDATAENMIIVAAGANALLTAADVRARQRLISSAGALLVQFEVPLPASLEAIKIANAASVPVVLNPSPLLPGFPWGRTIVDFLITNSGEAESIFGLKVDRLNQGLASWRLAIRRRGVRHLIITRGSHSTLLLSQSDFFETPTLRLRPVDTVGAGDAFAGVLATRLGAGLDLHSALRLANCAGGLATLKRGAQESIPDRAATERAARRLDLRVP